MGLTANGLALLVIAGMLFRGHADSRWGLAAVILAALSLPALGPVGELTRSVLSAFVPMVNSLGASGGGAVG
jgi:hypothetical protein